MGLTASQSDNRGRRLAVKASAKPRVLLFLDINKTILLLQGATAPSEDIRSETLQVAAQILSSTCFFSFPSLDDEVKNVLTFVRQQGCTSVENFIEYIRSRLSSAEVRLSSIDYPQSICEAPFYRYHQEVAKRLDRIASCESFQDLIPNEKSRAVIGKFYKKAFESIASNWPAEIQQIAAGSGEESKTAIAKILCRFSSLEAILANPAMRKSVLGILPSVRYCVERLQTKYDVAVILRTYGADAPSLIKQMQDVTGSSTPFMFYVRESSISNPITGPGHAPDALNKCLKNHGFTMGEDGALPRWAKMMEPHDDMLFEGLQVLEETLERGTVAWGVYNDIHRAVKPIPVLAPEMDPSYVLSSVLAKRVSAIAADWPWRPDGEVYTLFFDDMVPVLPPFFDKTSVGDAQAKAADAGVYAVYANTVAGVVATRDGKSYGEIDFYTVANRRFAAYANGVLAALHEDYFYELAVAMLDAQRSLRKGNLSLAPQWPLRVSRGL